MARAAPAPAPAVEAARRWLSASGICLCPPTDPAELLASLQGVDRRELDALTALEARADAHRVKAQKARDLIAALIAEGVCR